MSEMNVTEFSSLDFFHLYNQIVPTSEYLQRFVKVWFRVKKQIPSNCTMEIVEYKLPLIKVEFGATVKTYKWINISNSDQYSEAQLKDFWQDEVILDATEDEINDLASNGLDLSMFDLA